MKAAREQKRSKQASISKECKIKDEKTRKCKQQQEGKAGIKEGKKRMKEGMKRMKEGTKKNMK